MWAGPRVINHLGAFPPCSLSLDSFFFFYIRHGPWQNLATPGVSSCKARTHHHPSKKDREDGWENKFAELLVAVDPGLTLLLARHPMINSWTPVHEVDITVPLSVSSVFKCHFVCIYLKELGYRNYFTISTK